MLRLYAFVGTLVVGCGVATSANAATELLFNLFTPPRHIINTGILVPWTKDVEKATSGRVTFKIPPKSMAPPPRQFDLARTATADMAFQFNAFLRKRVSLIQISLLPLMGTSAEGNAVALWRTYKKYFEAKNQFRGVVLLGFFGGPGGDICSLKEPITSVAALKKLKMWSLPSYPAEALKRLGVTVVPGPAVRIYPIVSKGIVDGYSGLDIMEGFRFKVAQFAKSCTIVPEKVFQPTFSVLINPKKWAAIPAQDKAIITKMSGEALARRTRAWVIADAPGAAKMRADGKKVYVASAEFQAALRKAWKPMHDAWIKEANAAGVDGKAAFEYYRGQSRAIAAEIDAMKKK